MSEFVAWTGETLAGIVDTLSGLAFGDANLGYVLIALVVVGFVLNRFLGYR